jgi:hypothetical protein
VTYTQAQAEDALAGFAFGKVPLSWVATVAVTGTPLGAGPSAIQRYKWAYHSFDCVPSSPFGLSPADFALTAALGSQISAEAVLALSAMIPELATVLAQLPLEVSFWNLPVQSLVTGAATAGLVAPGSPEWCLWRVWALCMGVDGVGIAITHKTLHHKRPWQFPMLDNETRNAIGPDPWGTIHQELTTHSAEFDYLEGWFAVFALARGGVPLTRLRIHDILLWGDVIGDRVAMINAGAPLLGR